MLFQFCLLTAPNLKSKLQSHWAASDCPLDLTSCASAAVVNVRIVFSQDVRLNDQVLYIFEAGWCMFFWELFEITGPGGS